MSLEIIWTSALRLKETIVENDKEGEEKKKEEEGETESWYVIEDASSDWRGKETARQILETEERVHG